MTIAGKADRVFRGGRILTRRILDRGTTQFIASMILVVAGLVTARNAIQDIEEVSRALEKLLQVGGYVSDADSDRLGVTAALLSSEPVRRASELLEPRLQNIRDRLLRKEPRDVHIEAVPVPSSALSPDVREFDRTLAERMIYARGTAKGSTSTATLCSLPYDPDAQPAWSSLDNHQFVTRIARWLQSPREAQGSDDVQVVRTYAISLADAVIDVVESGDDCVVAGSFQTVRRAWSAAPYLSNPWRAGEISPEPMLPYIDFEGSGIVRTVCTWLFWDGDFPSPTPTAFVPIPTGAVCADVKVKVASATALNPLLSIHVAEPGARGQSVKIDGGETYAVALRDVVGPPVRKLVLAAAFWGLAAVAFVFGSARERRLAEASAIGSLLRDIDVGVVLFSRHSTVLGANERAEQIIGLSLPKLSPELHLLPYEDADGDTADGLLDVARLFDDRIVLFSSLREDGELQVVSRSKYLPAMRMAGVTSTYYARIICGRKCGSIVRITGAPFGAIGNHPELQPRAFVLVHEVSAARNKDLSKFWSGT